MARSYSRVAISWGAAFFAASSLVHAQPAPAAAPPAKAASAAAQPAAPALTLLEAYWAAFEQDATLRGARAKADAGRERLPQARAALLPNISLSVARNHNDLVSSGPGPGGVPVSNEMNYFSGSQVLSVRQPLYRPFQTADLRQARSQVADTNAQLERETQNLAARVAGTYLDALLAQDQLELVGAKKASYTTQLDAARRRFAAGAGVRTDIDEAQARLDLTVAQELEARQQVSYTRRALQVMVNRPVDALASLNAAKLDIRRDPGTLDTWVERALQSSPEILSLTAQRDAARAAIDKARAGHLPTLDLVAQWSRQDSDTVTTIRQRYDNKAIGVQLNVPLFAGGAVNSQVRQALAMLEQAEQALEAGRRDLALRVEKEYRNVTEGASKIAALEQAVRSADVMVTSSRRSYQGGARTLLDILAAEEQRVTAQRDLAQARYLYLLSRVRLQALAGAAGEAAISEINATLAP